MNCHAVVLALVSAALFGVSTPAAKALLGSIDPTILAGLVYCGAGLGVAILRRLGRFVISRADAPEVALSRKDVPWLAGAIVTGGVIGPILLMAGLARTDAATTSLLLTFEGAATALMAWFVFHENFDRRIALGMACLVAGAVVLSWTGHPSLPDLLGPLAIVGACIAWGLDNNLTRKVSLADPLQIVERQRLDRRALQSRDWPFCGWAAARDPGSRACRRGRLSWLWREPGTIRARLAASRHRAHGSLFLDGTISRHACRRAVPERARDRSTRCGRFTDGDRRLAAPHRGSRPRT